MSTSLVRSCRLRCTVFFFVSFVALALGACGNRGGDAPGGAGEASGGGGTGGGGAGDRPGDEPSLFRGHFTQFDLLALAHLADVEHDGLFIDFGTPARFKHTVGNWRSGWLEDRSAGATTYTLVGTTGRVYFHSDRPGPATLRFRLKGIGTRNVTLYLNGRPLETGIRLAEGGEFGEYDVRVGADGLQVGENHLLLRFGGSTVVDGKDVSVALDWLRVIPGDAPAPGSAFSPPLHGDLVTEMRVGGDQRRALAVRVPTALSFYVEVPRGQAKLGFSVGADGEPLPRAMARVFVTPEGGERAEVFSAEVTGRWQDHLVALEPHAGQVVRIDMVVEGQGGPGRVGWATPAILVPEPARAGPLRPAKNVVVVLIDTQRADRTQPYAPETRVRTPTLLALAAQGAVFEAAQAPENWTKPSTASVLTGLWPMTHQAKTDAARVPERAVLVSETFKEAGFATGSFIANGFVSANFGFAQGWDHYTNYIRQNKSTEAENVYREAAAWIEAHKNERFFAYIHTIDPHVPYDPPADLLALYDDRTDYRGQVTPRGTPDLLEKAKRNPPAVVFDASDLRRLEALYDGEVTYHDREFGKFLERLSQLGLAEDTLVVVTADHGEEFRDHGSYGHGHSLYQEMVHVPLMFRLPGRIEAGIRLPQTVSTVDIVPTILELTGVRANPEVEGRSLVPLLRGAPREGPEVAFSDMLDDRRSIRAGRWKLILRGMNPTLFDLETDPKEQRDLPLTARPIAARYLRILLGQFLGARDRRAWFRAEQGPGVALPQENTAIDDTLRQQLGALGYAGGDTHGSEPTRCSDEEPCPGGQRCVRGRCVAPGNP
jgi:arylsulfatase A-like enzyme